MEPHRMSTSANTPENNNDGTQRTQIWHRFEGDDWAAYDALPPAIRARLQCAAYDTWPVNVLILWRHYRRQHTDPARAERALSRYLNYCETLERADFAQRFHNDYHTPLPHDAAQASILRQ